MKIMRDLADWDKVVKRMEKLDDVSRGKLVTYAQGLIDGRRISAKKKSDPHDKQAG